MMGFSLPKQPPLRTHVVAGYTWQKIWSHNSYDPDTNEWVVRWRVGMADDVFGDSFFTEEDSLEKAIAFVKSGDSDDEDDAQYQEYLRR